MKHFNHEKCDLELKTGFIQKTNHTLDNNGNHNTKVEMSFWTDVKLVLYGHICWICGFGVTRSLTVAYPDLKQNFGGSDSLVGLFTTMILLGNAFGSPLSVFLMKYIKI